MKLFRSFKGFLAAGVILAPAMGWAQQAMLTGDTQINSAATTTRVFPDVDSGLRASSVRHRRTASAGPKQSCRRGPGLEEPP
jgi:uncharacterized protein (DUF58 family)